MTIHSAIWPFPARMKTELQIDSVLLIIAMALLMGGFVILASASISISNNAANNPFFYIQRQRCRCI
jgi:cell division protein FtsW